MPANGLGFNSAFKGLITRKLISCIRRFGSFQGIKLRSLLRSHFVLASWIPLLSASAILCLKASCKLLT